MKLVFKRGKQRKLINEVINKIGSERKVSRLTGISTGAIYRYKTETALIAGNKLNKLLTLISKTKTDFKESILTQKSETWGQKKGGLLLVKKKKALGTFDDTIFRLKKLSSERMKAWHLRTREQNPVKYYTLQYERFKKVGKYSSFCGSLKVRNALEAKVASFLASEEIKFEYESCLILGKKAYFPDFKIGNLLIEATFWSHPSIHKISYLTAKVNNYKAAGYNVIFFVPASHRNFYKQIGSTLISNLRDLRRFMPR